MYLSWKKKVSFASFCFKYQVCFALLNYWIFIQHAHAFICDTVHTYIRYFFSFHIVHIIIFISKYRNSVQNIKFKYI